MGYKIFFNFIYARRKSTLEMPRPRTRKKSEAKDRLFEDRPSRSQEQEWSRPRTEDRAWLSGLGSVAEWVKALFLRRP